MIAALKFLAVLAVLGALLLNAPAIFGYHHGVTPSDGFMGAHCIHWAGQLWCQTK